VTYFQWKKSHSLLRHSIYSTIQNIPLKTFIFSSDYSKNISNICNVSGPVLCPGDKNGKDIGLLPAEVVI
jgi:hypothetical protein